MKLRLILLACLFIIGTNYSQKVNRWFQDGKVIFELSSTQKMFKTIDAFVPKEHLPLSQEILAEFGIISIKQLHPGISDPHLLRTYEIEFEKIEKVEQLIQSVRKNIEVAYVEKKELHESFFTPNDTYFANSFNNGQWGLFQISAPQAWDIATGDANVVVAVTDNAIQINHPDLVNKMVAGRDVVDNDNDPSPCAGNDGFHGSHVAGIVGAETNNNLGIASIGYNVSVMPIKIGNCTTGALTGGYDGIIWATDNGADAINMSWGGGGTSTYGQNVCNYAWNNGVILIAAAGNDGTNQQFYPAAYNNVISVASTTNGDVKSGFSQYGTWVDVSAPGSSILSCNEGTGYQITQGTSMASPMVAGLVGLMISHAPSATPSDIVNCLLSSADNIDAANANYVGQLGSGRINAEEALICLNAFTFAVDAGITQILRPEGQLCTSTIDPEFTLRNFGSQTLTSAAITYQYDNGPIQTINWTGSLAQGATENITLPIQTMTTGVHTLTVSCNSPNGGTDQNSPNDSETNTFNIIPDGQIITVELTTDCWGSEVNWTITPQTGTEVLLAGGPYTDITGGQTYQTQGCLAAGCYRFTITDGYGDGMYGSQYASCGVDGSYSISESTGNVVASTIAANANYGTEEINDFCITSNLSYDMGVSDILHPSGTICNASIEAQVVLFNAGALSVSSLDITYDYGTGPQTITYNGTIAPGTYATTTLPVFNASPGNGMLTIILSNPNGVADENGLNDQMSTEFTLYDSYTGLPFSEDFESNSFATNNWYITNEDNDITWDIVQVAGTSPGDKAAKMDFFNYSVGNERDGFQTAPFDFSNHTNVQMTFEHAFRRYNQESRDSLAILVSTDCGASFEYIGSYAEDGTGTFATAVTSTVEFVPAAGNWCMGTVGADCFTIDLNAYSGLSGVIIKFESVNNGIAGNNLFIDNINITGTEINSPPTASFNTNVNGACVNESIQFLDNSTGGVNAWSWDFGDGNSSSEQNPNHVYTAAGTYTVTLVASNSFGSNSTTQVITVNNPPTVSLTAPTNVACQNESNFALTGSPSGGIYAGPGMTGSTFNPNSAGVGTHTITYTYTDGNGCSAFNQTSIQVFSSPSVSLTSPMNNVCSDEASFSLNGSPSGGTYNGAGTSGALFSPVDAGIGSHTISYNYTDGNGCSSSANLTLTVEDCANIDQLDLSNIRLFPNPNKGSFTLSGDTKNIEFKVWNLDGRLVYQGKKTDENQNVEMLSIRKGLYTLELYNKESKRTMYFVVY